MFPYVPTSLYVMLNFMYMVMYSFSYCIAAPLFSNRYMSSCHLFHSFVMSDLLLLYICLGYISYYNGSSIRNQMVAGVWIFISLLLASKL